jgi:hypothetical protein
MQKCGKSECEKIFETQILKEAERQLSFGGLPSPEKSKIRHKIDFILKNEPVPSGVAMSELSNGTKNIPRNLVRLSEKLFTSSKARKAFFAKISF